MGMHEHKVRALSQRKAFSKILALREELLRIWAKKPIEGAGEHKDERLIYRLLHKYNGTYGDFEEWTRASEQKRASQCGLSRAIAQMRLEGARDRVWDGIERNPKYQGLSVDPDARCRAVLRELDRAISTKNESMDSRVLHAIPQRFPTSVLRIELEDELDRLLREQTLERERAEQSVQVQSSDEDSSDSDMNASDEELQAERTAKKAAKRVKKSGKDKAMRLKDEV
jgi:hypothetical protein